MHLIKVLLLFMALAPVAGRADCQLRADELPVHMVGLQALVQARINDNDVALQLDSGAAHNLLLPAAAQRLGLTVQLGRQDLLLAGVGGVADSRVARVARFGLKKATLTDLAFVVAGNEMPGGAVGLLGQSLLSLNDVEYDLAQGQVRLMAAQGCGSQSLAYWAEDNQPVVSLDLERGWPMAISTVEVNGVKMRALFDSGASSTFLSLAAAQRIGLTPESPGVRPAGNTLGVGPQERPHWSVPIQDLRLGEEHWRNLHVQMVEIDAHGVDMLLGMDFFLAHRIYVANGQRKVYFTLNQSAAGLAPPPATPQ